MSTVVVELIELEIEKIDLVHLVLLLAPSTCISCDPFQTWLNRTHRKSDNSQAHMPLIYLNVGHK